MTENPIPLLLARLAAQVELDEGGELTDAAIDEVIMANLDAIAADPSFRAYSREVYQEHLDSMADEDT